MRLKYKLVFVSISVLIFFFNIGTVSAILNLKSYFFNDIEQASLLINREVDSYPVKKNLAFTNLGYKFLTAISMIGIKTYERDSSNIISDFRSKYGSSNNGAAIFADDLLLIDSLTSRQENLSESMIAFYQDFYKQIAISASTKSVLSDHYIGQVYLTLNYLPKKHTDSIDSINIHYSDKGVNGYGGMGKIFIRGGYLIDNIKFKNVLLHEIAHVVDTSSVGTFISGASKFTDNGTIIFNDDPSLQFFKLSWSNETSWKANTLNSDFVSTYASTNPFEDFAESYSLYVGNGNYFRCMAKRSPILEQKYLYLKDNLFGGQEYFTGESNCDSSRILKDVTDL